ncbi:MAG: hypothetical protein KAJ73_10055 [Zetaproteobacteria bacterium]|nr:hypothetical protein [Zetaproteobacteria bacterium]
MINVDDMKLHEKRQYDNYEVMRVRSGWIYRFYEVVPVVMIEGSTEYINVFDSVFVPWAAPIPDTF